MSEKINNTAALEKSFPERSDQHFMPFRIEDWTVEPASNQLIRGEERVKLEPKVMEVLVYLSHRAGEVATREEIEAVVWVGTVVGYDTLTGAIQKLRKAFNDDPRHPRIIETLSKRGYRMVATVQPLDNPPKSAQTRNAKDTTEQSTAPGTTVRVTTLLVFLSVVAGALFWFSPWPTTDDTVFIDTTPSPIAVLPFDNLSVDPEQEYFADGMTDDLITGLAKSPDLLVIARDSTFVYKGQSLDIRHVADKLNVRFIVHGSVRRVGDLVRINAQLVDATTGSHLWAERYDRPMSRIFELQDEITQKIVSSLAARVMTGERQDLGRPLTNNSQAYDYFLYGRHRFYLYANKDENQKARTFFQRAIDFDPNFALAYAMLGWTHAFDAMNGWSELREESLQRAQELAAKAIALQEAIPVAYFVKGLAYREMGEQVKALVEAEKAIEYDPNYANAHVLLATLLYYAGRPQEGLQRIVKAMQLNPHHPYNYTFHLGQAYFILRRYDEAIEAFGRGLASNPASERLHVWQAASYAQSGDIDEAEWEADQALTLNPEFSLERMQEALPFNDPQDLEHFLEGLRKAGLSK